VAVRERQRVSLAAVIRASFAVLLAATSSAAADPAAADKSAAEAVALDERGDFRGAAEKFAEAHRADPQRLNLFCNIGISYYKAQDFPRAHLLLGRCLERSAPDPKFVDAARAALTSVETTLRAGGHTPVTVNVVPTATSVTIPELFPGEAFVGPRVIWLPFGTFHLAAHAEGYRDETVEVVTSTQAPKTVELALQRPVITQDVIERPPLSAPAPPPPERRSKVPALVATGGTLVAATLAGVAFFKGRARAEFARTALDDEAFAEDEQAVSTWNTTLGITGSLAIVGAGLSGFLWYRAYSAPRVEVNASGSGASVSLRGRF
jgi:hypothetical protein